MLCTQTQTAYKDAPSSPSRDREQKRTLSPSGLNTTSLDKVFKKLIPLMCVQMCRNLIQWRSTKGERTFDKSS